MNEHDAHGLALLIVGRRLDQRQIKAGGKQYAVAPMAHGRTAPDSDMKRVGLAYLLHGPDLILSQRLGNGAFVRP